MKTIPSSTPVRRVRATAAHIPHSGSFPIPITTQYSNSPKGLALFCKKAAVFAFSLLAAIMVSHQSFAQPGVLDSTFGTGGKVTLDRTSTLHAYEGTDVAIQSDQKILISIRGTSSALLARLDTNGTLDSSFGVSGYAAIFGAVSLVGAALWRRREKIARERGPFAR